MNTTSNNENKNQVVTSTEKESSNEYIKSPSNYAQNDNRKVQSTRDDSWHRPFSFEVIANEWFRELDRVSERFGFPPSLFSRRLTHDFYDDDFGFDRHLSRWMPPAISRIMREFDSEFRGPSSLFDEHDSRQLTEYTEKIFDKLSNYKNDGGEGNEHEVKFPSIEPNDDLLNRSKDLEDFYNRHKSNEKSENSYQPKIFGRSYTSSTISKNGKSVTVSKHSELNPDGTINTRLDQKYRDNEGHDQAKSWEKRLSLNDSKQQQNTLKNVETH
jgi:hypothetical protein